MEQDTVNNGIKLVGEAVLPGGALLLDGQIGPGVLHTVAAVPSAYFRGPLFIASTDWSRAPPAIPTRELDHVIDVISTVAPLVGFKGSGLASDYAQRGPPYVAAVSLLGPLGLLVVKANSYSCSVTGLSLAGQVSSARKSDV